MRSAEFDSCDASACAGSRPAAIIAPHDDASTTAPAASVAPSRPSVPAARIEIPDAAAPAPCSTRAAASASSWQRPPPPVPAPELAPASVTVVSPPQMTQRLPFMSPRSLEHAASDGFAGARRIASETMVHDLRGVALLARERGRALDGETIVADHARRDVRERGVRSPWVYRESRRATRR